MRVIDQAELYQRNLDSLVRKDLRKPSEMAWLNENLKAKAVLNDFRRVI